MARISLRKREVKVAGTVNGGRTTHALRRGVFDYVRTERNITTCGRQATGAASFMTSRKVEITCGNCTR